MAFQYMTIDEAIRQYCNAAMEKADLSLSTGRDHALHNAMAKAWRALEKQGSEGYKAFKQLLSHESRYVRCRTASKLLAVGDPSGLFVLQVDAKIDDLQGFDSKTVLEEWKSGRLKAPFATFD
jgi:hypothetical protein